MTMGPLQNGFDQRIEVNVVKSSLARLNHENEKKKKPSMFEARTSKKNSNRKVLTKTKTKHTYEKRIYMVIKMIL